MLFELSRTIKINKMKYIIGFAFVLFFIGCTTTREFPDDRYQPVYEPVYQPYGYYSVDPYYNPAYDYSYRDRVIYDNTYRNRHRAYRYDNRQPQYRYEQQPRYRVIEPRVQERQVIQPRVQPRDKVYPDGTIKKADGTIIHPGQQDRN
jgi:hypothetical protein